MYDAQIRDFRNLKKADISLEPERLSFVIGKNKQGKTSLRLALAAALTETKMPNGQPATTGAAKIVRRGANEAIVSLSQDGQEKIVMTWKPKGVDVTGGIKKLGLSAVGLTSVTRLKPEERAKILIKILDGLPSEEETMVALKGSGVERKDDEWVEMWASLKTLGWEVVLKEEEKTQALLKGQWCTQTNNRAWNDDGLNWKPPGWSLDCTDLNVIQLDTKIKELQTSLDGAIRLEAVHSVDLKRLKELAATVEPATKAAAEGQVIVDAIKTDINVAKALLNSCPLPGQPEPTKACPCCLEQLIVRNGELYKPETAELTPEKRAQKKAEHDKAKARVADLQAKLAKAESDMSALTAAKHSASRAANELKDVPNVPPSGTGRKPDEIRTEITDLNTKLSAIQAKTRADALYKKAIAQIALVQLLKPESLQLKKLTEKLGDFNAKILRPLCDSGSWGHVTIEPDMSIKYTATDGAQDLYEDISESEQWRVDTILQIAIAKLQGDKFILMDRSDVLDKEGRGQLLKLLMTHRIGGVLFMTCNAPDDVPNLADKGCGVTYWIEKGVLRPVSELVGAK